MPEQKKLVMPAEVRRIYNLARVLGNAPKQVTVAFEELLGQAIEESRARAADPDTKEEKRAFWCGANHALSEVLTDLRELQGGDWCEWGAIKEWRRQSGGQEE